MLMDICFGTNQVQRGTVTPSVQNLSICSMFTDNRFTAAGQAFTIMKTMIFVVVELS